MVIYRHGSTAAFFRIRSHPNRDDIQQNSYAVNIRTYSAGMWLNASGGLPFFQVRSMRQLGNLVLSSKLSVSRHISVADKKGKHLSDYLMRLIFHKAMCGGNDRAHKHDQIDGSVGHISFQHGFRYVVLASVYIKKVLCFCDYIRLATCSRHQIL